MGGRGKGRKGGGEEGGRGGGERAERGVVWGTDTFLVSNRQGRLARSEQEAQIATRKQGFITYRKTGERLTPTIREELGDARESASTEGVRSERVKLWTPFQSRAAALLAPFRGFP